MSCIHYDCENRNIYGYCKTSACINPLYCNHGSAFYGQGVQRRVMTNADRVRAMSDNELANFFDDVETQNYFGEYRGVLGWLDWLKQEASDDSK